MQNFKAQRVHHITIHNSKIFSIIISITSPSSKVYNSAVEVHARLKFVLWGLRNPRAILFFTTEWLLYCRRQRRLLLHQENRESNACICIKQFVHEKESFCGSQYLSLEPVDLNGHNLCNTDFFQWNLFPKFIKYTKYWHTWQTITISNATVLLYLPTESQKYWSIINSVTPL